MSELDPRLVAMWTSLADHFLDTETRDGVVRSALVCCEAGVDRDELERVWFDEVVPVVGGNLWSVAGEWAGWPDEWLLPRLAERRARRRGPTIMGRLRRRSPTGYRTMFEAIATLLERVVALPEGDRAGFVDDASLLAGRYFDFGHVLRAPSETPTTERAARLAHLFDELEQTFAALVIAEVEAPAAPRAEHVRRWLRGAPDLA